MIRILIIDDHPLVSDGITLMLKDESWLQIIATAKNGISALDILKNNTPEIILLDISLPDTDGLQLCSIIRRENSYSKILGLTSTNEASIITQFLHNGGNGYLLKNMERADLLEAIQKVLGGKIYLSKAANEKVLEQFSSLHNAINAVPVLTRREKEILLLVNDGLNGPQIAERLILSPFTVETHRKNMLQKFNVTNTTMLLKVAREYKLL